MKTLQSIRWVAATGFLLAALPGCTQRRQSTPNAEGPQGVFHMATLNFVQEGSYHVDPPDEIIIKAPAVKEIDGSKQEVRPDGKISLNLLGDVKVSGLTPDEISSKLKELAATYYKNPDVKAEVTAKSKFYTVFGQGVTTPGKKPYTGHDTVIKAVAECGFSPGGWPEQVYLNRPGKNGEANARAIVNFTRVFEEGDMRQNYILQEGDIIFVPEGPLVTFGEKVNRTISPFLGVGQGVGTAQGVGGVR